MRIFPRLFARSLDVGPSDLFGKLTLGLGLVSLVPLAAPFACSLAAAAGAVGTILSGRSPERFGGRRWIMLGLALCVFGMALFFAEGAYFLRGKVRQSYEQKAAVSRLRLVEIRQALERYRQERGSYPRVSGIMNLKSLLEPRYLPDFPVLDGFEQAFTVDCRSSEFTLRCQPPPPPGHAEQRPPAIEVHGAFQPAPSPAALPPGFIGPPPPPALSAPEAPAQPLQEQSPRMPAVPSNGPHAERKGAPPQAKPASP